MTSKRRTALLLISALLATPSLAEYKVGDEITLPSLEDQFEADQTLRASTRWLLFADDMEGMNIIRDSLDGQTAEELEKHGIQFYADISGMPGLISRFIAIPRLQELAYPIALAREEELLMAISREKDKATVLEIAEGKVKSVTIVGSVEQARSLIGLAAGA